MEHFISYFLKVNLILSALYFFYWLFLRREKFFQENRFFLLGAIAVSLVLPLVPGSVISEENEWRSGLEALRPFYLSGDATGNSQTWSFSDVSESNAVLPDGGMSTPSLKEAFLIFYGVVVVILCLRFFFKFSTLYNIIAKTRKSAGMNGLSYWQHDQKFPPFSFLGFLVINPAEYNEEQLRQIMAHEEVHIRQWHTLDLLVVEFMHIFLWLNPLMRSMKVYLKLNLEYIADHGMLDSGFNKMQYQVSLLNTCLKSQSLPLTNLFSSSKLKMRIKMMNAKESPLSHLWKYAIVLPIVLSMYFVNSLFGQSQASKNPDSVPRASLYSIFEGYYQLNNDIRFALRIGATDKGLVLKELWTDREINFQPVSDVEFRNAEMVFPLKFVKGNDGRISEVVAFERDRWIKVNDLNPSPVQEFRLTPDELKAFVGYYQFEKNPDSYLEFKVKDNGLVATQLWDGKEFFVLPVSPMEFQTVKEKYPAKFTKDQSGKVTQVLVFNQDTWKKVARYSPRPEITLSSEKLKALQGKYTLQGGEGQYIQISDSDSQLVLKESWTGNEVKFIALSELEFINRQRAFPLKFRKDNTGRVVSVLAFNKDLWIRAGK